MDREEVLKRSREENNISDERTEYISLKGANFSMGVLIILWLIIKNVAQLDDAACSAMGLLVNLTAFSNFAYQFVHNRTKTVTFFCVAFLVIAISYLILFLKYRFNIF